MKETDVIILLILGVIVYFVYKYEYNKYIVPNTPTFSKSPLRHRKKKTPKYFVAPNGKKYPYHVDYMVDEDSMYDPLITNQYHPDYVEVLSVLDKMIKQSVFNPATLPVIVKSDGEKKDVYPIANRFVFELSRKTGVSLKLVDIIYIKKQITEDQERIKFDLVIQKESPVPSKIKMLLRVAIIYNTNDVITENNFFDEAWRSSLSRKPLLDEVFVLGYSSGYFDIESQAQTEYYAFKDIDEDSFMDESTVNDVVRSVRRKHALENGCLNVAWDEDGRDYYVSDLDATNWGNTDRRGTNAHFTSLPKPCSSFDSDELYGAIGTKII